MRELVRRPPLCRRLLRSGRSEVLANETFAPPCAHACVPWDVAYRTLEIQLPKPMQTHGLVRAREGHRVSRVCETEMDIVV